MSSAQFAGPAQPFRTAVPIGMGIIGAVALSPAVAEKWDGALGERLPSSKVKALFWGAMGIHLFEASVAARRAKADGMPAGRWVAQTLMYGVFSLSAQKKVAKALAAEAV